MKKANSVKRGVAFSLELYEEWDEWDKPIQIAVDKGFNVCYIRHYKDYTVKQSDDGSEIWEPVKPHVHVLLRCPNAKTVSALSKTISLDERWIQVLSSWRDFALYLIHGDYDSRTNPAKSSYSEDDLKGNYRNEVIQVIHNYHVVNQSRSSEDDFNIMKIIDFIESIEVVSTALLIRWCCENGLYSVLRRSSGLIRDVVREHNEASSKTVTELLLGRKVMELESRMSDMDREIEKKYCELFERLRNPYTNKMPYWEDAEYKATIASINHNLSEIQNGS